MVCPGAGGQVVRSYHSRCAAQTPSDGDSQRRIGRRWRCATAISSATCTRGCCMRRPASRISRATRCRPHEYPVAASFALMRYGHRSRLPRGGWRRPPYSYADWPPLSPRAVAAARDSNHCVTPVTDGKSTLRDSDRPTPRWPEISLTSREMAGP